MAPRRSRGTGGCLSKLELVSKVSRRNSGVGNDDALRKVTQVDIASLSMLDIVLVMLYEAAQVMLYGVRASADAMELISWPTVPPH